MSNLVSPTLGSSVTLEAGLPAPLAITLRSDDRAAMQWLAEFFEPWFVPTTAAGEIEVSVSSARHAYAELSGRRPLDVAPRACFAFDQQVVSLPTWSAEEGVAVADVKRSCLLVAAPRRIALFGDPSTRRWRFTLQLVFHEVAAARARRTDLDLHAAAVEAGGRAVLIVGPKRAGKTTLSFHLLRSEHCRWITNDRAFVGNDRTSTFMIRGMPTAVRIQSPLLRAFPELGRGLRNVERPYLHTVDEVTGASLGEEIDATAEFALSPPQLVRQLNVKPLASAPLGAIVFPEIRPDTLGFAVERLETAEVSESIWANLYGRKAGRREPTLFEELDGGMSTSQRSLAEALAETVSGYRAVLGPDAYEASDFAARLLEAVLR